MPSEVQEGPSESGSVILVRVGGRSYSARNVKQCLTCRSKHRNQIEHAIISGMPYAMIVSDVVEPYDDHSLLGSPTYDSILRHVRKGHMPLPYSTRRKIIEQRAEEIGKNVADGQEILADNVAIYRAVIQRGFERLNSGEIEPSMQDLMAALKLQSIVEATDDDNPEHNEDLWRAALMAYMEIVKNNVSHEVFQQIGREMSASPAIRAIGERRKAVTGGLAS